MAKKMVITLLFFFIIFSFIAYLIIVTANEVFLIAVKAFPLRIQVCYFLHVCTLLMFFFSLTWKDIK